jgi:hypothetical protein
MIQARRDWILGNSSQGKWEVWKKLLDAENTDYADKHEKKA